ncbi:MAG: 30S ribosomal protein S7 [Candidatus Omnitrophica bacterium]|nr:30S ribosomal protein S7 [Candidatus Omnitrophota bacterium]
MRRRRAVKKETLPDAVYNSKLVQRLINLLMWEGKKAIAEKIVYSALEIISQQLKAEPLDILQKAVDNVRPLLEVRPRRVGGATYQVPMEVKPERGIALALRWMRDAARKKKGKPMREKLAEEILEAYKGQGFAIKKREETHKMAEANKAFAHFRW